MNFPSDRAETLLKIEDRYGSEFEGMDVCPDQRIRPGRKIRAERKQHAINETRRALQSQPSTTRVTDHVRAILSRDAVTEKGIRPGYIATAEHSLDQIMDTVHNIGEAALALAE